MKTHITSMLSNITGGGTSQSLFLLPSNLTNSSLAIGACSCRLVIFHGTCGIPLENHVHNFRGYSFTYSLLAALTHVVG